PRAALALDRLASRPVGDLGSVDRIHRKNLPAHAAGELAARIPALYGRVRRSLPAVGALSDRAAEIHAGDVGCSGAGHQRYPLWNPDSSSPATLRSMRSNARFLLLFVLSACAGRSAVTRTTGPLPAPGTLIDAQGHTLPIDQVAVRAQAAQFVLIGESH